MLCPLVSLCVGPPDQLSLWEFLIIILEMPLATLCVEPLCTGYTASSLLINAFTLGR